MARPRHDIPEEQTPLLAGGNDFQEPKIYYRRKITLLCILIVFVFETGAGLLQPALNAVVEERICHEMYPAMGNALKPSHIEINCKLSEVQAKLAMLRGWQTALDCIPGVLTTIPYGILADRWGRRRVLILSLFGVSVAAGYQLLIRL